MNFDFSDVQKELGDQVTRMLARTCPILEVRRVGETSAPHSQATWSALAEMGVLGAAIPEDLGGVGLGLLELCSIAEPIGYALAPVPFLSSVSVAMALLKYGSAAQKQVWLPRLASGQAIGCIADIERPGELDPARLETRFVAGHLTGAKPIVFDGEVADIALVLARKGADCRLFIVDLAQSGVTRAPVQAINPATSIAEIRFDRVVAEELGAEADWSAYRSIADVMAVLAAFEGLGGAEAALAQALDYAKQRKAFGRQVASYQAIKHKLAHAYVKIQLARANSYYAAWAAHTGDPSLAIAAPAALLSAVEAFSYTAQENNQVHGGISFTWEADCHFYYTRSKILATRLGGRLEWKERLVEQLNHQSELAA